MPVLPPSEVYAKQLFPLSYGYPLWEPEPSGKGEAVIGDIGYIWKGGFYRLFNAFHPEDHEYNKHGVPDNFKHLNIDQGKVERRGNVVPSDPICARTVTAVKIDANVSGTSIGGGFTFECSNDQGALIVPNEGPIREALHISRRRIRNYMVSNYQSWIEFSDHELNQDRIVFVSGWLKTTRWIVAAITQDGYSAKLQFNGDLGMANVSLNVSASRQSRPQVTYRKGPIPDGSVALTSGHDTSTAEEPFPPNQCIFLNYFKLKTRLFFIRHLSAAAEPREPQMHMDDTDSGAGATAAGGSDSDDSDILEQVPSPKTWDPVDYILDYILTHSDAEVAVASTEDISTLCGGDVPDDIPAYLERTLPDIEVNEEGLGALLFEDFGLDPVSAPEEALSHAAEDEPIPGPGDDAPRASGGIFPADSSRQSYDPPQDRPDPSSYSSEPRYDESKRRHVGSKHVLADTANGVTSLAYSPDSSLVMCGTENGSLIVWNAQEGRPIARIDEAATDGICALAFAPDSRSFVFAARDGALQIWDVQRGGAASKRTDLARPEGFVDTLAFAPDGRTLAAGTIDFAVRLYDTAGGAQTHTLEGHTGMVLLVAFSPGGALVASAAADLSVRVWDAASGALRAVMRGHEGVIYALSFSADAQRLLTGADDGSVRIWRVETGEELVTLREHAGAVWAAAFSPDGKRVLSAAGDGLVKVCDSFSGEIVRSIEAGESVNSAALSDDGKLACTVAADHVVRVWELDSGRAVAEFDGHEDSVNLVLFSPDGKRLTSTSDDGTLRVWDVQEKLEALQKQEEEEAAAA